MLLDGPRRRKNAHVRAMPRSRGRIVEAPKSGPPTPACAGLQDSYGVVAGIWAVPNAKRWTRQ
eukprot:896807-Pyramimonas_sp.AAC.1